jgi:hypothetical protein
MATDNTASASKLERATPWTDPAIAPITAELTPPGRRDIHSV